MPKFSFLNFRRSISLLVHTLLISSCYFLSFILEADFIIGNFLTDIFSMSIILLIFIRIILLYSFGLHRGVWRYVSVVDLIQIIKITTTGTIVFYLVQIIAFDGGKIPLSIYIIDWLLNIFILSGTRLIIRVFREKFWPSNVPKGKIQQRAFIVGTGDTAADFCKRILSSISLNLQPIAFIGESSDKVGTSILGIPVICTINEIHEAISDYRVDVIIIAISLTDPTLNRQIVGTCNRLNIQCQILSEERTYLNHLPSTSGLRDINPADLLGRSQARLDKSLIKGLVNGKNILITGAAGSIGSELSRQVASLQPENLTLIDHGENSLFFLEASLIEDFPSVSFTAIVGDVTNQITMNKLVRETNPDVLFHAAAHKHVPLMEKTPTEAFTNNVGGTLVASKAAIAGNVNVFVLVSTDKAVNPTNIMGATKRLSELIIQELNNQSQTKFMCVRFGNVLGSNASVSTIFQNQVQKGGPVTVTHPDVDRYFMSLPEAAGLILLAGAVGSGGQLFVLDMGDPVKIVDLAEMVISLAGYKPHDEIGIEFVGLRPGEKLSEQLNFDDEIFEKTGHDKLLILKRANVVTDVVREVETLLQTVDIINDAELLAKLKSMIPEYR